MPAPASTAEAAEPTPHTDPIRRIIAGSALLAFAVVNLTVLPARARQQWGPAPA